MSQSLSEHLCISNDCLTLCQNTIIGKTFELFCDHPRGYGGENIGTKILFLGALHYPPKRLLIDLSVVLIGCFSKRGVRKFDKMSGMPKCLHFQYRKPKVNHSNSFFKQYWNTCTCYGLFVVFENKWSRSNIDFFQVFIGYCFVTNVSIVER